MDIMDNDDVMFVEWLDGRAVAGVQPGLRSRMEK